MSIKGRTEHSFKSCSMTVPSRSPKHNISISRNDTLGNSCQSGYLFSCDKSTGWNKWQTTAYSTFWRGLMYAWRDNLPYAFRSRLQISAWVPDLWLWRRCVDCPIPVRGHSSRRETASPDFNTSNLTQSSVQGSFKSSVSTHFYSNVF